MTARDTDQLNIVPVDTTNRSTFDRLIQCYECEFSAITKKEPGSDGLFPLDTHLDESHRGFLAYLGTAPVGFNVIATKGNSRYEVCEFFVIPAVRKRGIGYHLAAAIFDAFPGEWEVKQIAGAEGAKGFWQRTIARYTADSYHEDTFSDHYWGIVTRQQFRTSHDPRSDENLARA